MTYGQTVSPSNSKRDYIHPAGNASLCRAMVVVAGLEKFRAPPRPDNNPPYSRIDADYSRIGTYLYEQKMGANATCWQQVVLAARRAANNR
jgi:hypothetical protein